MDAYAERERSRAAVYEVVMVVFVAAAAVDNERSDEQGLWMKAGPEQAAQGDEQRYREDKSAWTVPSSTRGRQAAAGRAQFGGNGRVK